MTVTDVQDELKAIAAQLTRLAKETDPRRLLVEIGHVRARLEVAANRAAAAERG